MLADTELRFINVLDWVNDALTSNPNKSWNEIVTEIYDKHDLEFVEYVNNLDISLEEKTRVMDYYADSLVLFGFNLLGKSSADRIVADISTH